jgi:hypothetical protein
VPGTDHFTRLNRSTLSSRRRVDSRRSYSAGVEWPSTHMPSRVYRPIDWIANAISASDSSARGHESVHFKVDSVLEPWSRASLTASRGDRGSRPSVCRRQQSQKRRSHNRSADQAGCAPCSRSKSNARCCSRTHSVPVLECFATARDGEFVGCHAWCSRSAATASFFGATIAYRCVVFADLWPMSS